jgi:hypothetical protein
MLFLPMLNIPRKALGTIWLIIFAGIGLFLFFVPLPLYTKASTPTVAGITGGGFSMVAGMEGRLPVPAVKKFDPPYDVCVMVSVKGLPDESAADSTATVTISDISIDSISSIPSERTLDVGILSSSRQRPLSHNEEKVLKTAKARLTDGTLTLKLAMPGATVAPSSIQLIGQSQLRFLIRPTENKDGELAGDLAIDGNSDKMSYSYCGEGIRMSVKERYTRRETATYYAKFLGSGFTVTGLAGWLWGFRRKKNEDDDSDD